MVDELVASDRLLLCGDPEHWRTAGLMAAARSLGVSYWLVDPFCPRTALELIDQQNITVSDWYPWQLMQVLGLTQDQRAVYEGVNHRRAWVGGARIPASLPIELSSWWGSILKVYLDLPDYPGLAAAELVVRDIEGVRCGPQQIGALWISDHSEADTAIYPEGDPEGETELLGFADEQGHIFSLGKRANALRTAYGWLSPQEGEVLLESHGAVAGAALVAIGRDNALALGYELDSDAGFFAVVVLNPEVARATPLIEIELLDFCTQKLSTAKCPFGLIFSDSLPHASGGDVDLDALYALVVAAHQPA